MTVQGARASRVGRRAAPRAADDETPEQDQRGERHVRRTGGSASDRLTNGHPHRVTAMGRDRRRSETNTEPRPESAATIPWKMTGPTPIRTASERAFANARTPCALDRGT